jgi:hypothetical protein
MWATDSVFEALDHLGVLDAVRVLSAGSLIRDEAYEI